MLKLSYAKCVIISMTNFLNFLEVRLNIMQKALRLHAAHMKTEGFIILFA